MKKKLFFFHGLLVTYIHVHVIIAHVHVCVGTVTTAVHRVFIRWFVFYEFTVIV